ncbi:MAG: hypothetical protein AAFU71_02485 [Cyanobacteria bacterium J06632_22]
MTRIFWSALPLAMTLASTAQVAMATPLSSSERPTISPQRQAIHRLEDTTGTVWDMRPF